MSSQAIDALPEHTPGTSTGTLLFPIGHCLGTYYTGSNPGEHVHQVRLGSELMELSDPDFTVWTLAHGFPEHTVPGAWDRVRVKAALPGGSVDDADERIDRLLGQGLLAEVDADAATDFARRHRLLPLHLGLGNSPEYPTLYVTGTPRASLVGMTRVLYELWLWAHLSPDLWTACEDQALLAREAGELAPDEADPDALLAAVLTTLHTLLAPSAVCLDLAEPGGRA